MPADRVQPTAQTVEELIDRFDLVRKVRQQHGIQLLIGAVLTALTIGYNVVTPPLKAPDTPWVPAPASVSVAVLFLIGGVVWVAVMGRLAQRRRAQPPLAVREHALRLIETTGQTTRTLLHWATAGQLLLCLGTLARIKLGDFPSDAMLWAGMVPTLILLVHGLCAAPTRERVLRR
jgi:hypothetical protein